MPKNKNICVTISPIICPKGHKFYPKVNSDGTIVKYEKCTTRNCRAILDRERVKQNIIKRTKYLRIKKPVKKTPTILINFKERPVCTICKITFYDQHNLDSHTKRMHQQK